MKIGARAHDFGKHSPEKLFELMKEKGLEAAHFAPYKAALLDGDFLEERNITRIREALEATDMKMSVLGCYVDSGTLDEGAFQKSLEMFIAHLCVAKAVGAGCVGTETSDCADENRERQYHQVLRFMKEAARVAEEADTFIGVEPVFRHTINTPQMLKRLLDDVDSPRLKVIFDPVNLLWEGNAAEQETLWEECIRLWGDAVAAIHLKDGVYDDNSYTPTSWGKGIARVEKVAEWVKTKRPDLPLLREEIKPESAKSDVEAIKKLFY